MGGGEVGLKKGEGYQLLGVDLALLLIEGVKIILK